MSLKIVHVVAHNSLKPQTGGGIKTASLSSALADLGQLTILSCDRRYLPENGKDVNLVFGGRAQYLNLGSGKRGSRIRSRRHRAAVGLIDRLAPDVVVADDVSLAPVAHECAAPKRFIHTHNFESRLHFELARTERSFKNYLKARKYARFERELLPQLDEVWAVSEADARSYQALGLSNVRCVPNVIPAEYFCPAPEVGQPGQIMFFGTLWWGPNLDGAKYLLDAARRRNWSGANSQPALHVLGAGSREQLAGEAEQLGVKLPGFVDSLIDYCAAAAVIAVPIAWGGGTKLKTLEAMAMGKPVVTTDEGAAGLGLIDGEHALIRPLGESFDRAVEQVANDPAGYSEMALRGRDYIRENFTMNRIKQVVADAIRV